MKSELAYCTRRVLLKGMLGTAGTALMTRSAAADAPDTRAAAASAHFPFGAVVPAREFPSLPLRTQTDRKVDAREWLRGHVTAVQLMFTGCSATCPIQGAIFSAAQHHLRANLPEFRFVSLSIDPTADTPAALSAWLKSFDAPSNWMAAAPRLEDVQTLTTLLRGEAGLRTGVQPRSNDAHTAQVYFLNRDAQLVLRSADLPSALQVASNLQRLAALGSSSAS